MPTYITQGRYTRDAIKGMIVKPEDCAEAASRALAKAGGRLIGYYVAFGEMAPLLAAASDLTRAFKSAGGV